MNLPEFLLDGMPLRKSAQRLRWSPMPLLTSLLRLNKTPAIALRLTMRSSHRPLPTG